MFFKLNDSSMLGYWWRYYSYLVSQKNDNGCIRSDIDVVPAVRSEDKSKADDAVLLAVSTNANAVTKPRSKWRLFFKRLRICHREPLPPPMEPTVTEKLWQVFFREANIATKEIIASSFASVCSIFCSHPFDVVKENLQERLKKSRREFLSEWRQIYITKGLGEFYRGHYIAQRESLFQTVSMFYTYQRLHSMLQPIHGIQNHPNVSAFVAGFLSATVSVLAMKPLNALRERREMRQTLLTKYGPICAAYTLRKRPSLFQLFRGCFSTFMFQGTLCGLRFLIYNLIRDHLLLRKALARIEAKEEARRKDPNAYFELDEKEEKELFLSQGESLIAGAISGILGDILVHPMDVVNTSLAVHTLKRQQYRYEDTCRHYVQCMVTLLRKNKIKGLYSGFMPTLIRATVSTAVQFAAYEKMQDLLTTLMST